jgi:hypothetical protein
VVNPRVQKPSSAAEMAKAAAIAKITEALSNDLFEHRASDGTRTRTATTGDCDSRGTVIFQRLSSPTSQNIFPSFPRKQESSEREHLPESRFSRGRRFPVRGRGSSPKIRRIAVGEDCSALVRWIPSVSAHSERAAKMAIVVGTGDFKYRIIEDWAKLPEGWSFKEVGAVGVDKKDNVYVFNRGEHPVMVFDREGNFLRSWGEGQYPRAHGVHMGPDDSIYLTDDGGHFVRKCSLDGKVLLELGVPGKPTPYMSGEPFHRCTHTALSPKGEIYVSDGYGNAKVHKYSPDGKLLMSWGEPGTNPGEFNIVHNICTDADGWVYVADRENHRVQVFDGNGKYETQWNNLHRPCGLYMDYTRHPVCYIGELGPVQPVNRNSPNLGPRVSIVDHQGKLLSRFGDMHAGTAPTSFLGPHGLSVDSRGDLYVGEVSWTQWPQFYPDTPRPAYIRSLQKYERVH